VHGRLSGSGGTLVEESLEAREDLADLLGPTEIGDRVCDRVAVAQAQQGRELFRIELVSTPALTRVRGSMA
jgi:hypothetical protein